MNFRLLPIAQAQLDGIWLYVATESGSVEIANREVPKSQIAFVFSQGIQKLAVGAIILRVARGGRDLKQLLIN